MLDKRVRYSLVVKNNQSGRESKMYRLMDINKETSDSEAMTGKVCSMPSILFGVPFFTESGLENSTNSWTYDQAYPAKTSRKELRKVIIPRDKFPE